MTRLVKVNTLAVAKRWHKQLRAETHPIARKRIGIWELPYQGVRAADYGYSSNTNYVVGNVLSVETKIPNLGKRIDV